MAYDGHTAKRPRTDGVPKNEDRGFGQQNFNRGGRNQDDETPNHVLLLTVMNPQYPITVDVLHTICTPSGKVLRIVIFKKNGVQAMVEFDGIDSAKRAKQSLHGADIYSGCCTLKVEFAKPARLNVYKNDNDSWDYTNPSLGEGNGRPALLQEPHGFGGGPYRDNRGGYAPQPPPDRGPYDQYGGNGFQDQYGAPPQDRFGYDRGEISNYGGGNGSQQGCVLMIYGLDGKKVNCDKIFNLFCLYGNIARVKFLKSKEGCAMIQMGDPLAVERSMGNLNGTVFFNCKMSLGLSKQAFLQDVQQPFELPDGTQSFKDYTGNRNNRFSNPEAASKNRIQPPSKILHFFNAPPGITEEELVKVFDDAEVPRPQTIKMFPAKTERSASGLLEFESISDALEGLIACNHTSVRNPNGKFPYTFKLCFSTTGSRF